MSSDAIAACARIGTAPTAPIATDSGLAGAWLRVRQCPWS